MLNTLFFLSNIIYSQTFKDKPKRRMKTTAKETLTVFLYLMYLSMETKFSTIIN